MNDNIVHYFLQLTAVTLLLPRAAAAGDSKFSTPGVLTPLLFYYCACFHLKYIYCGCYHW